MKNGMKSKVLKHIKKDTSEYKEQIRDDKKLKKAITAKKK